MAHVKIADAVNAGLSTASVKNAAGKFVEPKLPGAAAALKGATINADLTYDPINAAGDPPATVASGGESNIRLPVLSNRRRQAPRQE